MKPRHILSGINIYGQDFPSKTNELIIELSNEFKLPNLELSEDGIIKLEQEFEKVWSTNDNPNFTSKYLLALIAFLGEVYIKNHGGGWQMHLNEKEYVWEPLISFDNGLFSHYSCLYDTLSYDEFPNFWVCYVSKSFVNEWFK